MLCGDEGAEGVGSDVGREQEEGDGDRLLGAALGGLGDGASAGEPHTMMLASASMTASTPKPNSATEPASAAAVTAIAPSAAI